MSDLFEHVVLALGTEHRQLELETPLALVTQPSFHGVDDPGVVCPCVFGEVPTDKVICDADSDPLHPVQVSVCEADGLTLDMSPTDSVPGPIGHYKLRPKQAPRFSSDWSVNRWTKPYHTARIDLE